MKRFFCQSVYISSEFHHTLQWISLCGLLNSSKISILTMMLVAMTSKKKKNFWYLLDKSITIIDLFHETGLSVLHIPHDEGPYCALIKTEHSSKLYWTDLKIICHYILYYILFDDPWPRIFKSYWSIENFASRVFGLYILGNFDKFSSETYEWTFLKISLICNVPNAHISLWLYKMCQMVATFFCVKFSSKLQETHIETELSSAGWK